jgi:hypothetical protein
VIPTNECCSNNTIHLEFLTGSFFFVTGFDQTQNFFPLTANVAHGKKDLRAEHGFVPFHTRPKKKKSDKTERRRAVYETLQKVGIHCGFKDMQLDNQRFIVQQVNTKLQDIAKTKHSRLLNSAVRHALQEVT